MILLDTNVVSEPLRLKPDPGVVAWIDAQAIETLFLSTISLTELRFGIAIRRILPLFEFRLLPFDLAAAELCAELRARARTAGEGVGATDSYIAAIAAAHNLTVATRDTQPYMAMGVDVINPWNER